MKKSIFKRIGLIALAVCVAIGSFFVPITKKQYNSANAILDDTVVTGKEFYSSDIITVGIGNTSNIIANTGFNDFSYFLSSNSAENHLYTGPDVLFYNFSFALELKTSQNTPTSTIPFVNFYIKGIHNVRSNLGIIRDIDDPVTDFFYLGGSRYDYNQSWFNTPLIRTLDSSKPYRYTCIYWRFYNPSITEQFTASVIPTLDMVSVEICSGFSNPYSEILGDDLTRINNSTLVVYTDTVGCKYFFAIPSYSRPVTDGSSISDYLEYRIYYLKSALDFTDNQIYNQGYNEGLADNQQNIYDNGYNAGYGIGYGNGVTAGRADANDFTFTSLIGAVVDVPVQTIKGLLNFTFLGINLFDFILGLITLLLILFIVRLIRGG